MKNFQNQTTILLVESDSDWLAGVYSVLQEAGHNVITAAGGDEGFCVAQRIRPDLIVCEVSMPDISGIKLCYMIRADKDLHAAPFVLMGDVSNQNGEFVLESFRAGADDYFEKNCNRQFLAAKIARLIALQSSEAELLRRCQNLRRAELNLTRIIDNTSNLVASMNPVLEFDVFNEFEISPSKKVFSKSVEPKNQMSKKNADALEVWKRALQPQMSADTNQFENEKREKIH